MKRALTLIAASFVCLGIAGTTALVRSQSIPTPVPIISKTIEDSAEKQHISDIENTISSEPDVNVEQQQAVRRMLKRSYQMETQQREIRARLERLSKK